MKQTIKFRLYPTTSQELKLHKVFKNYNKVKRIAYKLLFEKKDILFSQNKDAKKR